jgi:hypothetical protein
MTAKYLDKINHAEFAMNYWETSMKIDRVKAVLKRLKKDLKCYEKAIKEIEDRNDRLPNDWYIFRKLI